MTKYTLTIKYDEKNEEVEFLSEEVVISDDESLDTIDISEWYDKEILEFMDECYIRGNA